MNLTKDTGYDFDEEKNDNKKKSNGRLLMLAACAILIAFTLSRIQLPGLYGGSKNISVVVNHSDGRVRNFRYNTSEEFLSEALLWEELIAGSDEAGGFKLELVDAEYADPAKGQWWEYSVNGVPGELSLDSQPLKDGDKYEFTIRSGK